MPLSINVGLSRKASKDYQSTGYSINVTAELDQSLLARPEELQNQIAALYAHAHGALERQATPRQGGAGASRQTPTQQEPPFTSRPGGNGRPIGRVAPATESQKRAITAICRRLGSDPEYEAQQLIGMSFKDLSVKQASQLIDALKASEPSRGPAPSPGRNGGGR